MIDHFRGVPIISKASKSELKPKSSKCLKTANNWHTLAAKILKLPKKTVKKRFFDSNTKKKEIKVVVQFIT